MAIEYRINASDMVEGSPSLDDEIAFAREIEDKIDLLHVSERPACNAEFCKELGDAVTMIQLLPYHNLGVMKYLRISDKPVAEATPPSEEYMQKLKGIMEEYGLNVSIH